MDGGASIIGVIASVATTALSVASAAGAFTPDPPAPPSLDDKPDAALNARKAAVRRAQTAFGISRTRIANDDAVGVTTARGKQVVGPTAAAGAG